MLGECQKIFSMIPEISSKGEKIREQALRSIELHFRHGEHFLRDGKNLFEDGLDIFRRRQEFLRDEQDLFRLAENDRRHAGHLCCKHNNQADGEYNVPSRTLMGSCQQAPKEAELKSCEVTPNKSQCGELRQNVNCRLQCWFSPLILKFPTCPFEQMTFTDSLFSPEPSR